MTGSVPGPKNTEKAGDSVRKSLLIILLLLLTAVCACAAADTEYALTPCSGKMSLNEDSYIILTPDNLSDHPDLLSSIGKTKEELLADWTERGVQLQAWTKKMDACLEVTVIQDAEAKQYYDLEQQTRATRNEYLQLHKGDSRFSAEGWTIMKLEWKKQKLGGNFLKFEYKRESGTRSWRGVVRKTVRNGYTVMLDYQVFDRLPRGTDENYLNKIANTVEFESVDPSSADLGNSGSEGSTVSASASGLLQVTAAPPSETNEGTFTVEGHTTPGAHLIGVVMRWSSSTPLKFETDATKAGNFKLKITLPEEGVWLLTLNLEINGSIVAEEIFDTTTYSKTLLPVTLDAEVPEELTGDELVISGVTSKGVTVQCIVSNGTSTFDKTIRTNATGVFKFKVPTAEEGEYDITLAFSKKHFNSNRITRTARRNMTAEDSKNHTAASAIHPSYTVLVKKLDTYIGQSMVYTAYITDVRQNGDEWIITAALRKNNSGYSDFLVFMTGDDPGLEVDSQVKLYGKCIGAYQVQSEEENITYPGFDYLFHE